MRSTLRIRRERDGLVVASSARVADRFLARLAGLLFRPKPARGEALVITPCRSVHTFGMRYAIDVVFADRSGRVVALFPELSSGRLASAGKDAVWALETKAGTIAGMDVRIGDILVVEATGPTC